MMLLPMPWLSIENMYAACKSWRNRAVAWKALAKKEDCLATTPRQPKTRGARR